MARLTDADADEIATHFAARAGSHELGLIRVLSAAGWSLALRPGTDLFEARRENGPRFVFALSILRDMRPDEVPAVVAAMSAATGDGMHAFVAIKATTTCDDCRGPDRGPTSQSCAGCGGSGLISSMTYTTRRVDP